MRELPAGLVLVSLPKIETLRQRLYEQGFAPACDAVLSPDGLDDLVERLTGLLPGAKDGTVFESVRHLGSQRLAPDVAMLVAWRLAANRHQLAAGMPVRPWAGQRADEWAPVEILRATTVKRTRGDLATEFTLCLLAGAACGMRAPVIWSRNMCRLVASRIGFSRTGGTYPYRFPDDLVGLRCYGHVSATMSREHPAIREIECPPGLIAWNRKNILGLRCRHKQQCPNGWTHPCAHCAIGYETCAAATHYRTYVKQHCSGCDNAEAVFDPESRSGICIECTRKRVLQGA